MTIASDGAIAVDGRVVPLGLRLDNTPRGKAQGLAKVALMCAFVLKWGWWHTKSYLPIVAVLMLSLGSLLVLHVYWLYRRLVYLPGGEPGREKEVVKDAG